MPEEVASLLGATQYAGWIEGIWTLCVVPSIVWAVLGGLVVLVRGASGLVEAWRRLAIPLAVVIAFAHMCKGLAKVVSWVGFLPLAASDPVGAETAQAITAKALPQPASLLPMIVVSLLAMVLVITAAYFALRELRLAQGEMHRRYRLPVLVLASCFLFIVFGWGFLQ
jgi:hypothetical protein